MRKLVTATLLIHEGSPATVVTGLKPKVIDALAQATGGVVAEMVERPKVYITGFDEKAIYISNVKTDDPEFENNHLVIKEAVGGNPSSRTLAIIIKNILGAAGVEVIEE